MRKQHFIVFVTMLAISVLASAQIIKTKLDIVGGVSAREFVHGGLRYQYTDITQFGLFYGGDMGFSDAIVQTYCADNLIHFGEHSYLTNRPVWYARQGFTYSVNKENDRTSKFSYVDLGLGRDFGITDWLGINVDAGLIVQLREKREFQDTNLEPTYYTKWYWLPMFRLQLYISL